MSVIERHAEPLALALTLAAALVWLGPRDGEHPSLEAPVRVLADGVPIDLSDGAGHSGPLVANVVGDERPDLVVGDLRGRLLVFENVGERTAPRYVARGPLTAEGKPVPIHNW